MGKIRVGSVVVIMAAILFIVANNTHEMPIAYAYTAPSSANDALYVSDGTGAATTLNWHKDGELILPVTGVDTNRSSGYGMWRSNLLMVIVLVIRPTRLFSLVQAMEMMVGRARMRPLLRLIRNGSKQARDGPH
jgi:hypothetical protein